MLDNGKRIFINSVDVGVGEFGYNFFYELVIGIFGFYNCFYF